MILKITNSIDDESKYNSLIFQNAITSNNSLLVTELYKKKIYYSKDGDIYLCTSMINNNTEIFNYLLTTDIQYNIMTLMYPVYVDRYDFLNKLVINKKTTEQMIYLTIMMSLRNKKYNAIDILQQRLDETLQRYIKDNYKKNDKELIVILRNIYKKLNN